MLFELQREEIEAQEREERMMREAKEAEERKKALANKRRDDLLRGNPFKLATVDRARKRQN